MPSPRAVLADITEAGADPTHPHSTIGASGRLRIAEREAPFKQISASPAETAEEAPQHAEEVSSVVVAETQFDETVVVQVPSIVPAQIETETEVLKETEPQVEPEPQPPVKAAGRFGSNKKKHGVESKDA